MFNASHKDFACLLNIIESIDKIKRYANSYPDADSLYEDSKTFDAVLMNFIIIGEMAEKLTDSFKLSTELQIDWIKIRSFRNIIAHNYFGVDAEEVWQIIENSLPDLEVKIKHILNN